MKSEGQMYAVIKHSGKQYTVKQGDVVALDRIDDVKKDAELNITDVLLVNDGSSTVIGTPVVANALVKVKVLGEKKGDKVVIFKHRRRKNYRKKQGFRQILTTVKVEDIIYKNN
ncbi:MAG: 50S ribosomal protein L21 [Deltaproteobacteria bacterium]|nr:50S ribosomal protein L21 [Deltaproteobacteria bacterium]MCL5878684.1 50S ribosomal protein L21 [Deltaproteobacteria bacterium]